MILFLISLLHCTTVESCVTGQESAYAKRAANSYSWDFDLDDHHEEYDDSKQDQDVEPNRLQGDELVVTICDYDRNDNYYCYDLP